MMGQQTWRFPGTRHHYPAPKLHKLQERRQEEIMMGDNAWRFPGNHKSRTPTVNCLVNFDGRQDLTSSRASRRHHPVPDLQERRQEEIMMGDKNLRVPGSPGTTIPLPSYTSYKKGDKRRL